LIEEMLKGVQGETGSRKGRWSERRVTSAILRRQNPKKKHPPKDQGSPESPPKVGHETRRQKRQFNSKSPLCGEHLKGKEEKKKNTEEEGAKGQWHEPITGAEP